MLFIECCSIWICVAIDDDLMGKSTFLQTSQDWQFPACSSYLSCSPFRLKKRSVILGWSSKRCRQRILFWKFYFFKNANFRKSKFPGRFPFSLVCTWIAGKNVPGQWVGLGLEISIEPLWQPWLLPLQLGWAVLERESREGEGRCRQRLWLRPQVPPVQRSGMSHSTSYHLSKWLIKSQSTYLITKQGIPYWLSSDGERFMSTLIRYFSVSHSIMHWQDVFKWSLTYS